MTTDSSYVMPQPRTRRIFALSLGASLAALTLIVLAILGAGAPTAEAATYTLTGGGSSFNWSDTTKWSPSGSPGTGDTAIINSCCITANIDVNVNGVILNLNSSGINVNVPAGSTLKVEPSSTSVSGNNFNVNGGTLIYDSGTHNTNVNLVMNTGTTQLLGNVTFNAFNASMTWKGGTITGPGTITNPSSNAIIIDGTGGGMTLSGAAVLDNFGALNYTSFSSNSLSVTGSSKIKIESGGTFTLTGDDPMLGDGTGAIDILSGGTMSKSGGTSNNIGVTVNNAGTVTPGANTTIYLQDGGTHSGTFNLTAVGSTLMFNSSATPHTFNAGSAMAASSVGTMKLVGGNFAVNTTSGSPLNIPNFDQSSGTVGGTGYLKLSSVYKWTGGTQNNTGTTEVASGATATLNGSFLITLSGGRTLINNGTINYAPSTGFLTVNTAAVITNNALIDLQNNAPISGDATARIDNAGSAVFKKSGLAAGTTVIGVPFDLNGNAQVAPGAGTTIDLSNGTYSTSGTFGGTSPVINLSGAGSALRLSGGTFNINSGTSVSGTGKLKLAGTAFVNLNIGSMSVTNFEMNDSSTLKNPTAFNGILVGGTFDWNGGTLMGGITSTGVLMNGGTAVANLTGSNGLMTVNGTRLTTSGGAVNYNSGTNGLAVNNGGGVIINGGSFNHTSILGITSDQVGSPFFNIIGGATYLRAGASTPIIGVPVNIPSGTLSANGGSLELDGGGSANGALNAVGAGDRIQFGANSFTLLAGVTSTGSGTIAVMSGGTIAQGANFSLSKLELNNGGTWSASGAVTLTVSGGLLWTGGTFTGAGTLTLPGSVVTTMTSLLGPPSIASGYTVSNAGTMNYDPTSFSLTFTSGGTLSNSGTINITGNGGTSVSGAGNALINAGTINKTAGAGSFIINVPYTQNAGGNVDSQAAGGTLSFSGGGTMNGGTIQATNATSAVDFASGTFTIAGGNLSGGGMMRLNGATLTVNSAVTIPASFQHSSGTLNGTAQVSIPTTTIYSLTGGTMSGTGTTAVLSGGTLHIDTTGSSPTLRTLTIASGGTLAWTSGTNAVLMQNGNTITNGGTIDLQSSGTFGTLAAGTITNNATLQKTTGGGTVLLASPLANNGTVDVQTGTLDMVNTAAVTHGGGGVFNIASGATLDFQAGTHTGGNMTGSGLLKVTGATVTPSGSPSIGGLGLTAGTFSTANPTSVSGQITFWGGTLAGVGAMTAGSLSITGASGPMVLDAKPLTVTGNTTFNTPNTFTMQNGASITNPVGSTFDIQQGNLSCNCSVPVPSIVNNGTFRKSTFSGTSTIAVPITGSGVLDVVLGAIDDGANASFASANLTGVASFSGPTVTIGSASGAGILRVYGGATTVSGAVSLTPNPGQIILNGGGLTLNGTTTADTLTVTAGTIGGSGNITTQSAFVWSGGSIGGSGSLTLGGTATADGANGPMTLSRSLTNNATFNYVPTLPANVLTVASGTAITNNAAFKIGNQSIFATAGAPPTFTNSGASATLQRFTGTGTTSFDPAVTNNGGTVSFLSGTTNFTNGFTQSSGTTSMLGGSIGAGPGLTLNGGTLDAFGTITGNLTNNAATVNLKNGTNSALLSVTGSYAQSGAGSNLNAKINGTAAGSAYSQLMVGGNVALAGNLNVTLGYAPANGDAYDLVTYGTNSGGTDFTAKNFPPIPGGGTFNAAYVAGPPQALHVTAVTSSADVGVAQTAPATASTGNSFFLTTTATNSGPNAASSVVITINYSGPVTVSSAGIGAGGSCAPGSPGQYVCNVATLGSGSNITATLTMSPTGAGTMTANASVSAGVPDPNSANNAVTGTSTTIVNNADVMVTKTGPGAALPGSSVTYGITVTNNGPSNATGVVLTDPQPAGLAFVSATGACTGFPCTIGSMTSGTSVTISATYTVSGTAGTSSTNTATVSATTPDSTPANNAASVVTTIGCHSTPVNLLPLDGATGIPLSGQLQWNNVNAAQYNVYLGPQGSGCQTLLGTTTTPSMSYSGLQGSTTYQWRVEAVTPGCPTLSSSCLTFTTGTSCAQPPAPASPAAGATLASPVTFTWTAVPGATDYHLFASVAGGPSTDVGHTGGTSLTLSLGDGSVTWFVVATVPSCGPLQSASRTFNVCNDLAAPLASVVASSAAGQSYDVTWDVVAGASKYEIDESTDPNFGGATTTTVTTNHASFQHSVASAVAFFYRVRAFGGCKQQFSPYSTAVRIVLAPVVVAGGGQSPNVNVPAGSTQVVVQSVFIPGIPGGTFAFTASTDQPWMHVQPASGSLPPAGTTLQVLADPSDLPNGTFTGTLIVNILTASGAKASNGGTSVSVPVSISMVTPVSPSKGSPTASSLIIPAVGHLDGLNTKWQSDVRLTNTGGTRAKYQLTFTPDDPAKGAKTTTIDVAGGDTTALDDIVKNWYGVGTLGESANGVLLIRPLDGSGKGLTPGGDVSVSTSTAVASSRTYNVTSNGTLGQYIPAIPFGSFVGKTGSPLSLQQIAQNASYRTNLGVVEAAGATAKVGLTVFNAAGAKVYEQTLDLAANEQRQLNSFLQTNGISLDDGRVEVKVLSGDGKVTAYASVVDNATGDPLLVSGQQVGAVPANHYVLPGVAALNNGLANWRSDVRVFNGGTSQQAATLTFYPANGSGEPQANSIFLNAGEVKSLDDIVKSYFGGDNVGGALHVTTSTDSALVVTGRTYNLTDSGTYGQFIPAVTPNDGVGKDDRALNILQVEDSVRYRTNVGLAELSGNPATVEVTVLIPQAKAAPKITFELAPNEFRQTAILHDLGLENVYNARLSVRVISGSGKISAYGSVIDMKTQDPTYVPAQ
jgi:uncharacterized repeat protein (TIGR01451 family)